MSFIENKLIFLGGADPDDGSFENNKPLAIFYSGVGLVVSLAAFIAGLSMGIAIYQITQNQIAAITGGSVWGVGIGIIEHLIVTTMNTGNNQLSLSVARIFLAVIIGSLVSTPLVLYIFNSEIQNRIAANKLLEKTNTDEFIEKTYSERIKKLESRINDERNTINSAKIVCDGLLDAYLKEVEGTGGSLKRGDGRIAAIKNKAQKDCFENFQNNYPVEENEPTTQALKNAKEELKKLKDEAESSRTKRNKQTEVTDGYLIRLKTFHELLGDSDWQTRILMFLFPLLFCFCELMPVIAMLANSENKYVKNQREKEKIDDIERESETLKITKKLEKDRSEYISELQKDLVHKKYQTAITIQTIRNVVRSNKFIGGMKEVEDNLAELIANSIESEIKSNFGNLGEIVKNKQSTVTQKVDKDGKLTNSQRELVVKASTSNGKSNGFTKNSIFFD